MSHATSETGSQTSESASPATTRDQTDPTLWAGWIMFGSLMMIMLGAFHMVQGLIALLQSDYFLVGENGLTIEVDYTAWGWTHLILGAVVFATGIAVLYGQVWARVAGVVIAMGSALVNLAFLAAYPIWSVMMIAFDVLIIWALAVHGGEMKAARERSR
jgi:hypothetical protein